MYHPSNTLTVTSAICRAGHTYVIDPPVRLNTHSHDMETWSCMEPGFNFLVQGIDMGDLLLNFGNKVCEFYMTYQLMPTDFNDTNMVAFKRRVARTS